MTAPDPSEEILQHAFGFVERVQGERLAQDYAEADYFIVELSDPLTGHVTRAGFWQKDEEGDAAQFAQASELDLNKALRSDETHYEARVVPVFDRDSGPS